ncbi:MAG: hypothetical protein ACOYXT_11310 [Bacteroidota bacterium]
MNFSLKTLNVKVLAGWLCMLASFGAFGQNIESIGKDKPLTISGGISTNQIFYAASGIDSRRDPYSYYFTGNLNFNLYGWSVPLSFSLSNQNVSFQQPFNQYSLHPTYKWLTGHFGYTSMTFSPYTLNGHIFLGAGVDATPTDKLKISAMYGRLRKAVEPDSLHEQNQASYKRIGYGFKANYGDAQRFAEVILFRAKDETGSIAYVPEAENILPEENLVVSIAGGYTFFQKVQLKTEWSNSAVTRDQRAEAGSGKAFFDLGSFFRPRISTAYYQAIKSSLTYMGLGYSVGLGYERIDPEYRTLGSYFFNNDLENITVNGATALAGGKVTLSANVGTQRDNLDGSKITTMRRAVSSLNVGFVPNERLNISTSYSNFQTFTNVRSQFVDINQLTPYDNLDTLNFTQISQNANVNFNYLLRGTEDKRKSIAANLSIMKAADKQGEVEQNSGSIFYNLNTAYSLNMVPKTLTLSAAFNYSFNEALDTRSTTLGPSLSAAKSLLDKKLRISGSCSANNTYVDGSVTNKIISLRVNGGYTIKQKHNLNLSMVGLNRTIKQETGGGDFTEFTATLGYSYSFGN